MSIEDNKSIVHRFFGEGPSKGDLIAADELLAPDFALHVPLPSAPGIQGMNDVITACRAAFEHLNVTIEDMVAEGDKVAARFTALGIHKGAFIRAAPHWQAHHYDRHRDLSDRKWQDCGALGRGQFDRADATAWDLAAFGSVKKTIRPTVHPRICG
jgi:ketosteroid isomerase-like protein